MATAPFQKSVGAPERLIPPLICLRCARHQHTGLLTGDAREWQCFHCGGSVIERGTGLLNGRAWVPHAGARVLILAAEETARVFFALDMRPRVGDVITVAHASPAGDYCRIRARGQSVDWWLRVEPVREDVGDKQSATETGDIENESALEHEIKMQDNCSTEDPYFIVQKKHLVVGLDRDLCETHGWLRCDDGELVTEPSDPELFERLDRNAMGERSTVVEDAVEIEFQHIGYREEWVFVQAFLTRKAAEEFRSAEAHSFSETRVYCESASRNPEIQLIRKILTGEIKLRNG